jgi:light-regulated signal transduction histidine kinase (bacteriophytochrome)
MASARNPRRSVPVPMVQGHRATGVSSHHLSAVYAPAADYKDIASGLLAMSLPKPVDNGVLWFRPEVKESIQWSGDPKKPLALEKARRGPAPEPAHLV